MEVVYIAVEKGGGNLGVLLWAKNDNSITESRKVRATRCVSHNVETSNLQEITNRGEGDGILNQAEADTMGAKDLILDGFPVKPADVGDSIPLQRPNRPSIKSEIEVLGNESRIEFLPRLIFEIGPFLLTLELRS